MSVPLQTPFTISIPQQRVDNLKKKLSAAKFPSELDNAAWDMGAPLAEIQRLTLAWEKWDWRQAEARLNNLPQFTTEVDVTGFGNLDIHYIHQKSDIKEAVPLLFVHGWPGSFIEVVKLLPLLSQHDNKTPAFHIIAPSLPNYGFSSKVNKRGFAAAQYAETCHKLMLKLGYNEYVTQGGDWGFYITRAIGKLYPENCKASHINMIRAHPPKWASNPILALQHKITPYSQRDLEGFKRTEWFNKEGRAYFMEQSTKPQTLAYGMNDSPVFLLAWIYEKLHDWTDSYPWTDDEIFTWVSIYWFSRAGPGAAHQIYYEVLHAMPSKEGIHGRIVTRDDAEKYIPHVKLGMTYNPKELSVIPKTWGRTMGHIVYEAENSHGGHFYAHEHPELLQHDLVTMFGKGGGAYNIIPGKSGYSPRTTKL